MKKLLSLLLALTLCLSLAACGGPDRQPAVDAHNNAGAAMNELIDLINADPEPYADYIEDMQTLVDRLNEIGAALGDSSTEFTQEALDEYVQTCGEIEEWAKAAKAEIEG